MASPFTFGKKDPRQQLMEKINYQPSQTELNEAVNRKVAEQLLRRYEPPKQVTLDDLGSGFERGIIPGVVESAGQIGNYLINNPQGKQISAALLSGTAPAISQGLYQSGLADQKAYNQQVQQAELMNISNAKLGQQYLKDLADTERANLKSVREKENNLYKTFKDEPIAKGYDNAHNYAGQIISMVKSKGGTVDEAVKKMGPVGDAALVQQFQKMILPNEAVMADNFKTIKGQGWFVDAFKDTKGGRNVILTENQRREILETAIAGYDEMQSKYDELKGRFEVDQFPNLSKRLSRDALDSEFLKFKTPPNLDKTNNQSQSNEMDGYKVEVLN